MADAKITDLPDLATPSADDILPIVDDPAGTPVTRKITVANLQAGLQPIDSDLTAIAGLGPSTDDIIQRKAGAWTNRTPAQLIADLAALGTTFQPKDGDLDAIAALTTTSFGRSLLAAADATALRSLAGAEASANKGAASGYAALDAASFVLGNGLQFPASQVASADANNLDDYEEGTFTVGFTFATPGNLNAVLSQASQVYRKIGSLVCFRIQFSTTTFTHTTASGEARITGLPFAVGSTFFASTLVQGYTKASYTDTMADMTAGNTYCRLLAGGSAQAVAVLATGDFPTGGTLNIRIAGFYLV